MAPPTKLGVILKSNRATEARKEKIMDKEVAKPLRMLSLYFITIAVIKPPNTCMETVAQAQPPKFLKRSKKKPLDTSGDGGE